jgi:hypothetical protein
MTFDHVSALAGSHDLRLSAWGPYTKRYMGISHVPDVERGLRFDLSVFPGLYRRRVEIPNVKWEAGYHPWEAAPDLSTFSHRHELIWKDRLFADVGFCRLDDQAVLIRVAAVNRTPDPQNLVLHYMASFHFPPVRTNSDEPLRMRRVSLPESGLWVDGLDYDAVHFAAFDPRATLTYDGALRGEVRDHGFVDGRALGRGFGREVGDQVAYGWTVPAPMADACLLLRVRMAPGGSLRLHASGLVEGEIVLTGDDGFARHRVDVGAVPGGEVGLTLTSQGGADVEIDGIALVPAQDVETVAFEPVRWHPEPDRMAGPQDRTLMLDYPDVPGIYGLAWPEPSFEVRAFLCDDLDIVMRHLVHQHTRRTFHGPGDGHYTNVFMRPIFMAPESARTFYGLVCTGEVDAVRARLAAFDPDDAAWEATYERARRPLPAPNPAGDPYRFSQDRMAATVLTNVVYPVRTRGTWIRHNTPGRWWDSLYTWDSGFVGLGLLELDVDRAVDCLNAYVTEPDEEDAAFIHHGSPVPVQHALFLELWNRTQSRALLAYFYPRLRRYHRFLVGRTGSSTTRMPSNLIRTWDYFYNSGGWDDYPPQVHVHREGLEATVAPVVNTAQAIRTAKILRAAALALETAASLQDVAEYDEDIAQLSEALQTHAWDEASGAFGYVCHDANRQPTGILRHESGVNFNLGLGGAYPLVAGICTPAQEARLVAALTSETRMWSRCGLSTVDQSAPYYRDDGYWNGAVWMPHQWYFWKALLDLGRADAAYRIAGTGLDVWRREVERSYNCFEHFIVQTGRGAGWHHFGGLSTPVLTWYGAYYRPGRLTTGLDAWVSALRVGEDRRRLSAELALFGQAHHTPVVVVTLEPGAAYASTWNGEPVPHHERVPGALEITLPSGEARGRLDVTLQ